MADYPSPFGRVIDGHRSLSPGGSRVAQRSQRQLSPLFQPRPRPGTGIVSVLVWARESGLARTSRLAPVVTGRYRVGTRWDRETERRLRESQFRSGRMQPGNPAGRENSREGPRRTAERAMRSVPAAKTTGPVGTQRERTVRCASVGKRPLRLTGRCRFLAEAAAPVFAERPAYWRTSASVRPPPPRSGPSCGHSFGIHTQCNCALYRAAGVRKTCLNQLGAG